MAMSREQYQERLKAYGRVVAKAWDDEAFKQRLLTDPKAALQAEGLSFPEDAEVRVVEPNDRLVYFSLPPKPAGLSVEQLSAEQLSGVAGADSITCVGCVTGMCVRG